MNHFWKVNIHELQTLLYWILGNILLERGATHWGTFSIAYGWLTCAYTIIYAALHAKEIKDAFV